jgi:anthranilate synthase/aminodeoxychorismate synthase-like glutamine amidotransferase
MAHVHGGQVVQAPTIVHGKTSPIAWTFPHPLFKGMSNPFTAMRYHSLVVDEATLPECFEVIARLETGTDKPPGLIMAMQHRQWPMWGVQFHPESIGTPEGQKLLENFLHWQPA